MSLAVDGLAGSIGSLTDFATLALILWKGSFVVDKLDKTAAGVVALARRRDDVDEDVLERDLNVPDGDVDAILTGGRGYE